MNEAQHTDMQQGGSFMIRLTPIQTFIVGLVGGVLLLCTIGFFILLSMTLGGSSIGTAKAPTVVAPAVQPGDEQPKEVTLRAVDPKTDHVRGAKNPKVTIVTYTDLECPFCKRFHMTMLEVMKKYDNDVQWVFRNFPLDQLHQKARTEALAVECAGDQGKFWELTDLIFTKTTSNDGLDLAQMPEYAKQVGLNVSKFTSCWNDKKFADRVQADEADGQSAGAQGTPYSVAIGSDGQKVVINGAQPQAAVEATIEQLMQ